MTDSEFEQVKKDFANAHADNPTCYDPVEIAYLRQQFFVNHAAKLITDAEQSRTAFKVASQIDELRDKQDAEISKIISALREEVAHIRRSP